MKSEFQLSSKSEVLCHPLILRRLKMKKEKKIVSGKVSIANVYKLYLNVQ